MPIIESLKELDRQFFVLINHDGNIPSLDPVMLALRNPLTWIPLYVFMAWWCITRLKKNAWLFIIFSALTIGLSDPIAGSLLKPFFERLRPCAEPSLAGIVRILEGCGGKFSFPSNHAANHFALATFWYASIHSLTGQKWWWLWIWAFLICYAQVYVGKHYPGDILGGSVLGIAIGTFTFVSYKRMKDKIGMNPAA